MTTKPLTIGVLILAIIAFLILFRIFSKPFRWLFRLTLSCVIGSVIMLILNKLLSPVGVTIAINPLTSMISGVLGIPGIIMTYLLYGLL